MRKTLALIVICLSMFFIPSCVQEDNYDNTRRGNFEALWQQMDEHYCFFTYKQQELGVDWDEVHTRYAAQVNESMNNTQLFEVLCNMLSELQDGHVNLSAPFDYGRNWSYHEDHPENYNDSIARLYLGHNYQIASGLRYVTLDDNIGYVRCETFEEGIGDGNVSAMLNSLATCTALIIDLRGNGGGQLTKAHTLASHFTNEKTLVGYVAHKTGKGRNDFSTPEAQYLHPASDGIRWQKPVVVLTNRAVFSAANDFVKCMQQCPHVTIMGDRTGGGSGMPFNSELPNGWTLRYSAVVHYDRDMHHTEFGIAPNIEITMSGADLAQQRDTYIEAARQYLKKEKR
ncbi:MAG: S41 family peptidase [Bacteroidaceae bacterium]|nr:S41 family peptidase [Bacteroidaceae bacterium]